MKKELCLLLICCMLLALLPLQVEAFAEEYDANTLLDHAYKDYEANTPANNTYYDGTYYIEDTPEAPLAEDITEAELEYLAMLTYLPPTPFANVLFTGTIGASGAQWTLYDDGRLLVDPGTIHWTGATNPWATHNNLIDEIIFTGPITAGTSLHRLFNGLTHLHTIEGLEHFDTSSVTNMTGMFANTSNLTNIQLIDGWDTSNVTTMYVMFLNAGSLTNLNLSAWHTDSLTNIGRMFENASSLVNLDLSGWNTSNVTHMQNVFRGANSLVNLGLSGWDTSSVTIMTRMFEGANSLLNLDIANWNTSNVVQMNYMFWNASSLTSLEITNWDTSSVVNINRMFENTSSLTELDLSGWDTSNITSMSRVFFGTSGLTSLDVADWDTSNVTHMGQMFQGSSSLTSLCLSNWDTGSVTNMGQMFSGTSSLRQLTLGDQFSFFTNAALPNPLISTTYTGRWRNVGTGSVSVPRGPHSYTAAQLMASSNAGGNTWVWELNLAIGPLADIIFPTQTVGYSALTPHPVTVVNAGANPTGNLTITLSGSNPGSFVLSTATIPSIAIDGSATNAFTVAPIVGLAVGTHTATVTVSGTGLASQSFTVTFVVEPAQTSPPSQGRPRPVTNNPQAQAPTEDYDVHLAFMFGDDLGNFRPLSAITRGEVAAVLTRTQLTNFSSPTMPPAGMGTFNTFIDVQPDNWYYNYVAWAYDSGLIAGDPPNMVGQRRFRPNDPITRQEFAAMVSRINGIYQPSANFSHFYDWSQVGDWARAYVYTSFQTGWMIGNGQNNFRPLDNISASLVR